MLADTAITAETFVYEPYRSMGGGTVTPTEPLYGLPGAEDTVEVSVDGDVTVTRRTAVMEFDGTEDWFVSSSTTTGGLHWMILAVANIAVPSTLETISPRICTHYVTKNGGDAWSSSTPCISTAYNDTYNGKSIRIYDVYSSVSAWNAYLAAQAAAGTPVTIVYELAAPETETPADVDPIEPQIGEVNVFTDADS